MKNILCTVLACIALSGCFAVWGRGYHIETHTKSSITIKVDPAISDTKETKKVAQSYCAQGNLVAVAGETTRTTYGLMVITYDCKPPGTAPVTPDPKLAPDTSRSGYNRVRS